LRLVEAKFASQLGSPAFSQVAVLGELVLEAGELLAAERGSRSLLFGRLLLPFDPARSGTWNN